jgi:hypothetical protein
MIDRLLGDGGTTEVMIRVMTPTLE